MSMSDRLADLTAALEALGEVDYAVRKGVTPTAEAREAALCGVDTAAREWLAWRASDARPWPQYLAE